ncbi:hypothetical protein [Nocardioides bizhenqiangii]|uniref:Uncharacterized protein n=1 Tax=Nocardioides bizhenqiangii TaxID=3095076 RepID=A0ABZ0ZXT4_9ACTN|nr:hypothetical protein [Nocardioides sp. HM61]WQQ28412.1 hypothetical protein SHK19_09305 [Nocardioides sp. HM61]
MTTIASEIPAHVRASVDRLVVFLETGATDGLFAPDVFADITLPHWRVQAHGAEDVASSKTQSHPPSGRTRVEKVLAGADGYTVKVEERWEDGGAAVVLPRGVRLRSRRGRPDHRDQRLLHWRLG